MLVFVQVISHRGLPFNPTQTDIINPHSLARFGTHAKCASLYQTSETHTHTYNVLPSSSRTRRRAILLPLSQSFHALALSLLPRSKQNLRQLEKARASPVAKKKYNHVCMRTPTDWLTVWGMLTRRILCNFPGRGRGKYAWEPCWPAPVYLGADTWLLGMRAQCNCASKLAATRVYCNLFRGQWSRVLGFQLPKRSDFAELRCKNASAYAESRGRFSHSILFKRAAAPSICLALTFLDDWDKINWNRSLNKHCILKFAICMESQNM